MENEVIDQPDATLEAEARSMGWVSEAEFKGKEGTWKPAAEYVDYGKQVLPIMNATNQRLRNELLAMKGKMGELTTLVATSQEAIKNLNEFHTAETARQVAQVKKELGVRLMQARADDDTDAEVEIQTEIAALGAAEVAAKGKPPVEEKPAPKQEQAPNLSPAYLAFAKENAEWLDVDKRKTRRTILLGQEIVEEMPHLNGAMPAFYVELSRRIKSEFGGASGLPLDSKVEGSGGAGSGGHGGGGGGGGKGFSALPAEAKAACKADNRQFVGEGKMYPTEKAWQDAYAQLYYQQEAKA